MFRETPSHALSSCSLFTLQQRRSPMHYWLSANLSFFHHLHQWQQISGTIFIRQRQSHGCLDRRDGYMMNHFTWNKCTLSGLGLFGFWFWIHLFTSGNLSLTQDFIFWKTPSHTSHRNQVLCNTVLQEQTNKQKESDLSLYVWESNPASYIYFLETSSLHSLSNRESRPQLSRCVREINFHEFLCTSRETHPEVLIIIRKLQLIYQLLWPSVQRSVTFILNKETFIRRQRENQSESKLSHIKTIYNLRSG